MGLNLVLVLWPLRAAEINWPVLASAGVKATEGERLPACRVLSKSWAPATQRKRPQLTASMGGSVKDKSSAPLRFLGVVPRKGGSP